MLWKVRGWKFRNEHKIERKKQMNEKKKILKCNENTNNASNISWKGKVKYRRI